ncbi:hypothetical protein HG535_0F04450 [Zygotorulaspora mrakii]|uniref:Protein ARV n=1 Tax=Zygotorulaspora mrakii TaxID=42260 RepID=A0A7H9B607_ZYGMR|nr:uncharacterized protein HG535_0F04450 [Zygotorulaspora mrakii]QLG73933.1 hypothetical protein HG535_0F04450 [Zygotorulaspora mrakii]
MICIECTTPVTSLYVVYANNHIQLTECPNCHKYVDKYVEMDHVILFIDLLLLKSGAYRHLVYNSLENELSKYKEWDIKKGRPLEMAKSICENLKNWFLKFDRLNRIWVLLIAFEIYLTWVTEERKYSLFLNGDTFNSRFALKDLMMNKVFSWNPLYQYLYFAVRCMIDISIFHGLTSYLLLHWLKWGKDVKYAKDVLSYAILLSYGAKIFPILMLIWPYDNVVSMNIIKWIANLYIVESLQIVTNLPYSSIFEVLFVVSIAKWFLVKSLLMFFIAEGCIGQTLIYLNSEIQFSFQKFAIMENFFLL